VLAVALQLYRYGTRTRRIYQPERKLKKIRRSQEVSSTPCPHQSLNKGIEVTQGSVSRSVAVMVQRREPTLISTTQKYNVDPVGDGNVQQYSENALAKLEELLAEVDYECEKLGVLKDLTANLCTDQQLTDLNAHAVKANGQDWRKVNGRDGSGGSERRGGGGNPHDHHTGQLTCAAKGCRNKLSKVGEKSARLVAAKKGTDVKDHRHVCTHHFKEAAKGKVNGGKGNIPLQDGSSYTVASSTKAYKAMRVRILAANAGSDEPAPPPSDGSEGVPPTAETRSVEMTNDEYFAYRKAKEAESSSDSK
jgi:hypothetical protein